MSRVLRPSDLFTDFFSHVFIAEFNQLVEVLALSGRPDLRSLPDTERRRIRSNARDTTKRVVAKGHCPDVVRLVDDEGFGLQAIDRYPTAQRLHTDIPSALATVANAINPRGRGLVDVEAFTQRSNLSTLEHRVSVVRSEPTTTELILVSLLLEHFQRDSFVLATWRSESHVVGHSSYLAISTWNDRHGDRHAAVVPVPDFWTPKILRGPDGGQMALLDRELTAFSDECRRSGRDVGIYCPTIPRPEVVRRG